MGRMYLGISIKNGHCYAGHGAQEILFKLFQLFLLRTRDQVIHHISLIYWVGKIQSAQMHAASNK